MDSKAELFYRYLNNECTAEEVKLLLADFNSDLDDEGLRALILKQLEEAEVDPDFEQQVEVVKIFSQTDLFLKNTLFKKKQEARIAKMTWFAIAASIAICFTLVYLFHYRSNFAVISDQAIINGRDARPGTDKAILTLANGTSISLNENTDTAILTEAGLKIRKTKDGMLVYETKQAFAEDAELTYNQLVTPNGAKYKIILPDGTRVWLNAGSSLRYPVAFSASERRVELSGEGYFEVEKVYKDAKKVPFYVETETQIVQVLGTEFNISAYADDRLVRTTLISGKVNVSDRPGNKMEMLSPGEQAVFDNEGAFKIMKINTDAAISWKNGNFMFEDMYLKDIMKQLCRWYNVEVDYTEIPQTQYNIFISRNETLQRVLTMLGSTGNLKFQLNNNRIKITK